jgi:hypothetical protein
MGTTHALQTVSGLLFVRQLGEGAISFFGDTVVTLLVFLLFAVLDCVMPHTWSSYMYILGSYCLLGQLLACGSCCIVGEGALMLAIRSRAEQGLMDDR